MPKHNMLHDHALPVKSGVHNSELFFQKELSIPDSFDLSLKELGEYYPSTPPPLSLPSTPLSPQPPTTPSTLSLSPSPSSPTSGAKKPGEFTSKLSALLSSLSVESGEGAPLYYEDLVLRGDLSSFPSPEMPESPSAIIKPSQGYYWCIKASNATDLMFYLIIVLCSIFNRS